MSWESWKKGFDSWENAAARHIELWLKSPLVLTPTAALLTAGLRARAAAARATTAAVGALGLSTKHDQERTLHAIHRLESRLIDLEEKLDRHPSKGK